MTPQQYLDALSKKLEEMAEVVLASIIQRELDETLGAGFVKGRVTFLDGSILEFSEQLPVERQHYRIHYMDSQNALIVRWDSAPHHPELDTFPFHRHTPAGVEGHPAVTVLESLEQVRGMLNL